MILHGPNLWPEIPGFREAVLAYLDALSALGQALMGGFAMGLGLPERYFAEHGTGDPLLLLRFFNYPTQPAPSDLPVQWGVGEHTDYGLLTLLWQDDVGGLQVRAGDRWFDAPPIPNTFVCNVGDMLDRMTGGRYRSVPHRVTVNTSGRDRLSVPLFFDPDFDTPPVLKAYGEVYKYDPERWTLATGAIVDIIAIAEHFGLVFQPDQTGTINHNLRTVVIDAAGRVQKIIIGNTWTSNELVEEMVKAAGVKP